MFEYLFLLPLPWFEIKAELVEAPIFDDKVIASYEPTPPPTADEIALDYADRVSYCESGNDNSVSPAESSASGYFQFINSTWEWVTGLSAPASQYSYEVQLNAFLKLWDNGQGRSHWQPSEYCWRYKNPWDHFIRP